MKRNVMLAVPLDIKKLRFPVFCQPKIDGIRCVTTIVGGHASMVSSEGNPILTVPHIQRDLLSTVHTSAKVDGELYCPTETFEQICSIVKRNETHPNADKILYYVFDLIEPGIQIVRLQRLQNIGLASCHVIVVPTRIADNIKDLEYHLKCYLDQGYEGLIVRSMDGIYESKRSNHLMKFKPSKSDTYVIVGVKEELTLDGVPKGTLGSLLCKSSGGEYFSVGSGLTAKTRYELWTRRNELPGMMAVVKYQNITSRGVPRFPIVMDIVVPNTDTDEEVNKNE